MEAPARGRPWARVLRALDAQTVLALTPLPTSQNHYPERLGACIVIDAPRLFSLLWKAAKTVAASNTLQKCVFLRGAEARAAMAAGLFGSADSARAKFLVSQMELNRDRSRVKATWGDPHMLPPDFIPVPFVPP